MDLTLSVEQAALRDAMRELCRRSHDPESIRSVAESETGWTEKVWTSLAETGVLGIITPDRFGGSGAGVVELSTIMNELGRVLAPEPVLDAAIVPARVLLESSSPPEWADQLAAVSSGELLGALALDEPGDRWPSRRIATTATATTEGWSLQGAKCLVRAGDVADFLIVAARADGEVGLFFVNAEAAGVSRSPYRSPDRRRGAHVQLDGAVARRIDIEDVEATLGRVDALRHTALCAEAVGVMDAALGLTADYLCSRRQFGAVLASFQALSHRLADLHVLVEMARSTSLYATAVLEDQPHDLATVSRAAVQVCRSARRIGHETIHLHGGIGVTDEYVAGHFAARLMAIEAELGGVDEHLRGLAGRIGDYDKVVLV